MDQQWLLVADSTYARLFSLNRFGKELREQRDFAHTEGRLHARELTEDKPGRSFDSAGAGRHGLGTEVEPKAHEAERFARELGESLEELRTSGELLALYIIAPPKFLGTLRKSLPPNCAELIADTLSKNLVREDPRSIGTHLETLIRSQTTPSS